MNDRFSMFIMGVALGLILGFTVGIFSNADVEQKAAVEHGAAFYHSETGEFTWRNLKE